VALAVANWLAGRHRWTYPPVILGAVWATTLVVYCLREDLRPLSTTTAFMIALGVLCFSIGAYIPEFAHRHTDRLQLPRGPAPAPKAWHPGPGGWLLWVAVLCLPLIAEKALAIGRAGPTDSLLVNVRIAMNTDRTEQFGWMVYLGSLAVFGAGMHATGVVKSTRLKTTLAVLVALLYALISTGRTTFLTVFAVVGGGLAVAGRIRFRTFAFVAGGGFLVVFGAMAFLLNKGISADGHLSSDFAIAFTNYLVGGTAALNDFLDDPSMPLRWGAHTFRVLFAVGHALGIAEEPVLREMGFRFVPFPTNVYTVFRTYYEDFDWVGIAATQFLFGFLHSLAHVRARKGHPPACFLYGCLLYALIMQVFHDQYFTLSSLWIQALVLLGWSRVRVAGFARLVRLRHDATFYRGASTRLVP